MNLFILYFVDDAPEVTESDKLTEVKPKTRRTKRLPPPKGPPPEPPIKRPVAQPPNPPPAQPPTLPPKVKKLEDAEQKDTSTESDSAPLKNETTVKEEEPPEDQDDREVAEFIGRGEPVNQDIAPPTWDLSTNQEEPQKSTKCDNECDNANQNVKDAKSETQSEDELTSQITKPKAPARRKKSSLVKPKPSLSKKPQLQPKPDHNKMQMSKRDNSPVGSYLLNSKKSSQVRSTTPPGGKKEKADSLEDKTVSLGSSVGLPYRSGGTPPLRSNTPPYRNITPPSGNVTPPRKFVTPPRSPSQYNSPRGTMTPPQSPSRGNSPRGTMTPPRAATPPMNRMVLSVNQKPLPAPRPSFKPVVGRSSQSTDAAVSDHPPVRKLSSQTSRDKSVSPTTVVGNKKNSAPPKSNGAESPQRAGSPSIERGTFIKPVLRRVSYPKPVTPADDTAGYDTPITDDRDPPPKPCKKISVSHLDSGVSVITERDSSGYTKPYSHKVMAPESSFKKESYEECDGRITVVKDYTYAQPIKDFKGAPPGGKSRQVCYDEPPVKSKKPSGISPRPTGKPPQPPRKKSPTNPNKQISFTTEDMDLCQSKFLFNEYTHTYGIMITRLPQVMEKIAST